MLNRGLIIDQLPEIVCPYHHRIHFSSQGPSNAPLRIAILLGDLPLVGLLISGGAPVTPELFELVSQLENSSALTEIVRIVPSRAIFFLLFLIC